MANSRNQEDFTNVEKTEPTVSTLHGSVLPDGTAFLDTQVAGHPYDPLKNNIGMLRGSNGRVLKPIVKPDLGDREVAFYENLLVSGNPTDMEIMRYTPTYYGTREMRIFNKRIKFLEIEDITDGMSEPCVMDVKIGRRTWDPLATPQKKASEELKYPESKRAYGFCIPGFQVYRVPSGNLKKFDKSYGKKLNSETLVEALQTFLNATPNRPPCRDLVVRLLSTLWKILALFREQRRYHFYSSSLLIAYDAKRLRHHMRRQLNNSFAESLLRIPISRSKTFSGAARSLNSLNHIGTSASPISSPSKLSVFSFPRPGSPKFPVTGFSTPAAGSPRIDTPPRASSPRLDTPPKSPRINRTIDKLKGLKRSISLQNCQIMQEKNNADYGKESFSNTEEKTPPKKSPDVPFHKLCRTHSYSNNFDADIIQMKEDYAILLSELSSTCEEKQNWVRVYMIDFAHVFPAEDGELDTNYLEGIENLIKLLEKFLA